MMEHLLQDNSVPSRSLIRENSSKSEVGGLSRAVTHSRAVLTLLQSIKLVICCLSENEQRIIINSSVVRRLIIGFVISA